MATKRPFIFLQRTRINTSQIFEQLRHDLIGKDSYRGITLTYAWLANQFGHFSLGFIPMTMMYFFTENSLGKDRLFTCVAFISIIWFFFELYNFLGPLLIRRVSLSRVFYLGIGKKYTFNPEWKNIAYDTFTDLGFFILGTFTAGLTIAPKLFISSIVVEILLILILVFPTIHWYHTKMYQNYARYPFQFRLSQWNYKIVPEDKEKIYRFMQSKQGGHHLLIFGDEKSLKTSLGVGILNELSIQHKTCLYTTAIKLFDLFTGIYYAKNKDPHLIWTWKNAEFMVIDDINPSNSMNRELINSERFLEYLNSNPERLVQNQATLCTKNIIWILGYPASQKQFHSDWCEMLVEIGIDPDLIESIDLPAPN